MYTNGHSHLPDSNPLRSTPVTPWGLGSGIKILGVPVCCPLRNGTPEGDKFARGVWRERLSKATRALDLLGKFPESHVQYTLLRQCLSACKVNDLLRACPLDEAKNECAQMSWHMRKILRSIVGNSLTEGQWKQAVLAIRCGGLGIPDPVDQRPAARMAGIMTFLQLGPRFLGLEREEAMVPDDAFSCASKLGERFGPFRPWWSGGGPHGPSCHE